MITYRNQLKNKIDSLQKLINEINESGLEGLTIRVWGNCRYDM